MIVISKNRVLYIEGAKKLKKLIVKSLIIFTLVILFIVSIFFATGEYFFNYALVRKEDKPQGANRNILSDVSTENKKIIENNQINEYNNVSKWLNCVGGELINIISVDGLNLVAKKFYNNKKVHKYVIVMHGYSNQKEQFYDIACNYYYQGFNVIVPDFRAHGESAGKYIGMGWLDKDDIKLWIDKIINEDDKAQIVLHGVSMGAATAMMLSGDELPENVKVIIEDCGYTSVRDIFSSELKARYGLPPFPIIESMAIVTRMHAKYNILEASSLKQISKSSIPILIIHGNIDNFVPINMAYQIYDYAKNKDILIIDGAGHNECRFLEPKTYYDKVFNFINQNIKTEITD